MSKEVVKIRPNLVLSQDVLQGLIDRADEIQSCAVVINWKDKEVSVGWSQMESATLVFLTQILAQSALNDASIL